jgi:hypothetical protein
MGIIEEIREKFNDKGIPEIVEAKEPSLSIVTKSPCASNLMVL